MRRCSQLLVSTLTFLQAARGGAGIVGTVSNAGTQRTKAGQQLPRSTRQVRRQADLESGTRAAPVGLCGSIIRHTIAPPLAAAATAPALRLPAPADPAAAAASATAAAGVTTTTAPSAASTALQAGKERLFLERLFLHLLVHLLLAAAAAVCEVCLWLCTTAMQAGRWVAGGQSAVGIKPGTKHHSRGIAMAASQGGWSATATRHNRLAAMASQHIESRRKRQTCLSRQSGHV